MNKNKCFKDFLKGLENSENQTLMESVKKAFGLLFESDEEDIKVTPEIRNESFTFGTTPKDVFEKHFDAVLADKYTQDGEQYDEVKDYAIKPNSSLATFLDKVMVGVKADDRQDGAWMFDSENLWKLLENLKILALGSSQDTENDFTEKDVEQAFTLRSDILGTLKIEEI